MLTLDEAIAHCKEKAEELRTEASWYTHPECKRVKSKIDDCLECASEHEQLAEWLTDYKRLLALKDKIKSIVFSDSPDIAILKIRDMFTGENEE